MTWFLCAKPRSEQWTVSSPLWMTLLCAYYLSPKLPLSCLWYYLIIEQRFLVYKLIWKFTIPRVWILLLLFWRLISFRHFSLNVHIFSYFSLVNAMQFFVLLGDWWKDKGTLKLPYCLPGNWFPEGIESLTLLEAMITFFFFGARFSIQMAVPY